MLILKLFKNNSFFLQKGNRKFITLIKCCSLTKYLELNFKSLLKMYYVKLLPINVKKTTNLKLYKC